MSSRERRLLDKDKEIRKLKGTAGHYFTCTINSAIENEKLKQELIRTRKALDVAVDEITKIKVAAESVGIGFFMTAAIVALAKIKTTLEQKNHFANASKKVEQKDK